MFDGITAEKIKNGESIKKNLSVTSNYDCGEDNHG
jgi:hypothetical protein